MIINSLQFRCKYLYYRSKSDILRLLSEVIILIKLGKFLKKKRIEFQYSLCDVHLKTGITDTKLKRIEDGKTKEPSPLALIQLAELYRINIFYLYELAGYLKPEHITKSKSLQHLDLLNTEEIEHIQKEINFLINHRNEERNEI